MTCHILAQTDGSLQWHSRLARRAYKSVSTEKREGREFEPPLEQRFHYAEVGKEFPATHACDPPLQYRDDSQQAVGGARIAPLPRQPGMCLRRSARLGTDAVRRQWRDAARQADAHNFLASMGLEPMTFALLARRSNQLS